MANNDKNNQPATGFQFGSSGAGTGGGGFGLSGGQSMFGGASTMQSTKTDGCLFG